MRKLIPIAAAMLACAALSAALLLAAAPKNLDRAIEAQLALVAARPTDSGAENDLGSLLVLADDAKGAEAAYRKSIELDADNSSAHFNLGLLLQKEGSRREALKEYRRTLELAPRHAWAHYQIGTLYQSQGRDSAAKKAYARALAIDPSLGNPEVNPHLIDNPLATSAMLYSYRHYREELLPAKEFEEPARIARVLIDPPGSGTEAAAPAGTDAAEAAGGLVRGAGAAADRDAGGGEGEDSGETESADDPAAPTAESRVLSSKDLDPSHASNQIVGGAAPSRSGYKGRDPGGRITSTSRGRTREPQPSTLRPTLRGPQSTVSTPQRVTPPTTFLPTSDSTGMIETNLVEIDEWS